MTNFSETLAQKWYAELLKAPAWTEFSQNCSDSLSPSDQTQVLYALDLAVMETCLSLLSEDAQPIFLQKLAQTHTSLPLLAWMRTHHEQADELIQETLERTHIFLETILFKNASLGS